MTGFHSLNSTYRSRYSSRISDWRAALGFCTHSTSLSNGDAWRALPVASWWNASDKGSLNVCRWKKTAEAFARANGKVRAEFTTKNERLGIKERCILGKVLREQETQARV
eukprot:TRINITY_DN478_c0_g1_i1.p1 TRINITY_DN478_c0_g1~~TRINITY_DN478_c0_g1_i1.p1  ORF type:complete len:110 (-),score=6.03 TRINITY_DN478_c0_g1_i1:77-406(-)